MTGLTDLAAAVATTIVLMVAIFMLSRLLVRFGILPLSAVVPFAGLSTLVFYLLVLPGTVVHELSHYLACLLTAVRVREVRLFSPQENGALGWVVHDATDPLRRNIIALAPFVGCSLAIYALMRFGLQAPALDPLAVSPTDAAEGLRLALDAALSTLRAADLHRFSTWLVLYSLFSLGHAVAPSRTDLAHLLADGVAAVCLLVAVVFVDVQLGLGLSENAFLDRLAGAAAGLFQRLNALLFSAGSVVVLGALVIVPVGFVLDQFRSGAGRGG